MALLLEMRDVEVAYRDRRHRPVRAVAGVSLTIARGRIVGLVGESGCGKSTLARAAVGLADAAGGVVTFDGHPVTPLRGRARPATLTGLQLVFQDPGSSLNPRRSIGSQLADALDILGNVPRGERPARVAELIELVGLPAGIEGRYPHQFSGGQRQRLAIARALAADPSVLVLDEPLSSLDASAQAQAAALLVRLSRELEIGMLLISHDLGLVKEIADEVAVMYLGKIVERGATGDVWERPEHPYTRALIGALPLADGNGRLPESLAGEVPDPANPPPGCRFHTRCPVVIDRCRTDEPALTTIAPARHAACWLTETKGSHAAAR
ncbi:ABC transporter ATP-binding protein [Pseudonocardia acaciae]|uniref:ABC transporter ATP-binding protein n=1 Tax=Pseudonocardia acaciae TaxID=551276 RepID=UPI0006858B2A|nr:ABC transporter ATP-binding protein [Pseudonocardia acaciae]